jgi:thymidylate kinase
MQKLIIIRGNSASGKSTVAKKLRLKMGRETMLIPQDVVRRDMIRVHDTPDNPSIQLIYDMAMYGKRIEYDVIVEGILYKDKYEEMLHKLIKDFGGKSFIYYFDISFEETLQRHGTKPNKDDYGEKEMRSWWADKDYLELPNEKLLTERMSENEMVEWIYQDLDLA